VTVPPAAPSWTYQVTAWFAVFATVAVNEADPPVVSEVVDGFTVTAMAGEGGGGVVTEMVAVELAVVSATLVATTWNVPVASGAVYAPALVTLPPAAPSRTDQVTDWLVVFATVAFSETLAPVVAVAEEGLTETVTGAGAGATLIFDQPQRGAVLESAFCPDVVGAEVEGSLTNATTVYVPGVAGAT
jgi:hypothetical protein